MSRRAVVCRSPRHFAFGCEDRGGWLYL